MDSFQPGEQKKNFMERASGTGLERGGSIRQRSEPEVSQRDQYWGRQWVRGNSEPVSLWASDEDAAWALLQAFEHISHYVRKGISNAMSCTHGGGILNVTQTFTVFCIQGQWGREARGRTHQEFLPFQSKNPATYANDTNSFLPLKDPSLGEEPAWWCLRTEETVEARWRRARTERGGGMVSNLSKLHETLT